jgi:ABC-2 type transport system permease protein
MTDHSLVLPTGADTGVTASIRRIGAMVRRNWYLLRGSWPRLLELCYWPTVQLILWGFLNTYLAHQSSFFARVFGVLLAGVILWNVLFRSQLGLSLSFMEELWSRNLGNIMVSPLRPGEFVAALLSMSLIRTLIGVVPITFLAIAFFGFSVYELGFALVVFFINLLATGWAMGLFVSGLILRFGLGAETLAWALVFPLEPLSGVYYPLTTLPGWLQVVAHVLPTSYVFEGMRAVLVDHTWHWHLAAIAAGLNIVYLAAAAFWFRRMFEAARRRGLLLQLGE